MTSKSNSAENTEEINKKKNTEKYSINHEHCWRNCLNRFGSTAAQKFIKEVKPTSASQKGQSEQTPLTESDFKWAVHCREGKPCPTISLIVNKQKLEQIAKLTIESTLNQNLTELLNDEKEGYSESRHKNNKKSFESTEVLSAKVATPSKEHKSSELRFLNSMNPDSKTNFRKESSESSDVRVPILSQKGTKKSESNQKSVHLSRTCVSHTYNSSGSEATELNPLILSKTNVVRNLSIEINSTNLNETNELSVSSSSFSSYDEDENELVKWKKNCNEGVFALQSLVDKCEKDPNSVLATFKERLGTDRKLPNGSFETMAEPDQLYILDKTHGRTPGDPKYHLLMVDRSTSFHKADCKFIPEEPKPLEKSSEHFLPFEKDEITEEVIKTDMYDTSAVPNVQQASTETIPEVIQIQQSLLSQKALQPGYLQKAQQLEEIRQLQQPSPIPSPHPSQEQSSPQSDKETPPQSPRQSILKDQKQAIPPREKKASILFKENSSLILDIEEDKKKYHGKRPSGVSWRSLNPPSDSDSTASLEQVVKDATAKAETFRHNLDSKRQHSLLDIVKRKSTTDKPVVEIKPPTPPPPPKRKKFFNFKCLEKKKQPEKQKEELHSDSDEESIEEQEKNTGHSSSLYLDNYRRRNTSFIDNPVFEKKKELSQFLNNI